VVVENRGKLSERATEAVPRLIATLRAVRPDMVILLHGANDIAGAGGVAGGLAALTALQTMVHDVRLSGAGLILCTLLPQRAGPSRTADPIVFTAFNERVRDLARTEGATLADLAQEVDVSLIGVDGLHPIEAGYVRMAEVIFTLLRDEFEEPPSLH
jgi:lysophospholipase L1-like esterase